MWLVATIYYSKEYGIELHMRIVMWQDKPELTHLYVTIPTTIVYEKSFWEDDKEFLYEEPVTAERLMLKI